MCGVQGRLRLRVWIWESLSDRWQGMLQDWISHRDKFRASGSLNGYIRERGRANERDLEGAASKRGGDQFTVPTHRNGKVIIER